MRLLGNYRECTISHQNSDSLFSRVLHRPVGEFSETSRTILCSALSSQAHCPCPFARTCSLAVLWVMYVRWSKCGAHSEVLSQRTQRFGTFCRLNGGRTPVTSRALTRSDGALLTVGLSVCNTYLYYPESRSQGNPSFCQKAAQ